MGTGAFRGRGAALALALAALGLANLAFSTSEPGDGPGSASLEIVAEGLFNPRGLTLGPDGALYVAEAGNGGDTAVRAGIHGFPYQIGRSSRVTRVDPDGTSSVVLGQLPSVHTPDDVYGATGVAFIGDTLFVLTAAGGREVGDPAYDNAVLRVGSDGTAEQLFDLTAYNLGQPPRARVLDPARTDVEGGVPYGLAAFGGRLYATDGNHETVTEITPDGSARRLLEYPTSNHVLVGLTPGPDGALYVAEFGPWLHSPGTAKISRLTLDGDLSAAWTNLTSVIGVAFGPDGSTYALEFSSGRRVPRTGRLLRRGVDGTVEVLTSGLDYPTALTIGPDGDVYLSDSGHRSDDGTGRILRVRVAGHESRVEASTRDS